MLFFIICGFFALFPSEAIYGAQNGLALCINAIIPSLLPFMIISKGLLKSGFARPLGCVISKIITPITGLSPAGCVCIVTGLIGGYGAGVSTVKESYTDKSISKEEAEKLLGICNNAGPIFIIGTVGIGFFNSKNIGIMLFIIQIITVLICARIFSPKAILDANKFSSEWNSYKKNKASFGRVMTKSVYESGISMINVCSYVITFSAILGILKMDKYPIISGVFEVMQGCGMVSQMGEKALPIISGIISWGGLCVHFQADAICDDAFSMKSYYIQKITTAMISCGITYLFQSDIYVSSFAIAILFGLFLIFEMYTRLFRQRVFRRQRHS